MLTTLLKGEKRAYVIAGAAAFALFLLVRIVGWSQTILLEDHDSAGYITEAAVFQNLDWRGVWNLSPDTNPVYPALGALCSIFTGGNLENGLRLCSFLSSIAIFYIIIALGRRLAAPALAVLFGLLFYALSPYFIDFSFSVLSEPLYVAITGFGLLILIDAFEAPRMSRAILLGLVFGIGFMARTEGLLYIAFIPGIMALRYFAVARKTAGDGLRTHATWSALYVALFLVVIAPQIWRVSSSLGQLGINGRQVWTLLLKNDDGKSYDEKIYGLDHSEVETNLRYVSRYPEAQAGYISESNLTAYIKVVLKNYDELLFARLPVLLTPLGIALGLAGIAAVALGSRPWAGGLVVAFLVASLVGPLIHNVVMRHVAILGPPSFLLQGCGLVFLAAMARESRLRFATPIAFACLGGLYLSQLALPLKGTFSARPSWNREYDHFAMQRFSEKLLEDSGGVPSLVVSRKIYLSALTGNQWRPTAFGSYDQLVRYCRANEAHYLLLEHQNLDRYPFLERFREGTVTDAFELIHEEEAIQGGAIQLYRVRKEAL